MGKYPGLKKRLIESLKEENCYYESDEVIVDQIIFNIELMNEAQKDLKERGLLINMTRDPNREPYICPNPASNQYDTKLKNLMSLLNSLGLSKQGKKLILDMVKTPEPKNPITEVINGNYDY
jgi:P27 family predicted phage terminase small subunit